MIDVTHDRDHGRTRLQIFRRFDRFLFGESSCVLFLANSLESEFTSNQFDLIEIESLIDRDHESEILECKSNDLSRGNFENCRELTDSNEFVDVNSFFLALRCRETFRL